MLVRNRIPDLFLGALLAVAVFAIGFVFGVLPHSGGSTRSQDSRRNGDLVVKQSSQNWWNDATADFTLGLVIVGGFQLALFYVQLKLIRKSVADAHSAAAAAHDAATAASANAKGLISAERARFHIVISSHTLDKFIRAASFYPNSGQMPMSGEVEIIFL